MKKKIPKTKRCVKCDSRKLMTSFTIIENAPDGHSATCKKCKRQARREHTERMVEVAYRPDLNPTTLDEFVARRDRIQIVTQQILTITDRLGRVSGTLRRKTPNDTQVAALAEQKRLNDERDTLRAELLVYKKAIPIPKVFYAPRIVDDGGTIHKFRKLKTLNTACRQRNDMVARLVIDGMLTNKDQQTVPVKVGDFQTTCSQKMGNKKKAIINTKTKC